MTAVNKGTISCAQFLRSHVGRDQVPMISPAMTPTGYRFQPQKQAQKQSTDILAALFQWDMVGVMSKFGANFQDFFAEEVRETHYKRVE